MPSEENQAIRLIFQPVLRVAGEVIEGEVHLHFPSLMKDRVEEVHVKLRGSVYTRIKRQYGEGADVRQQRVHLAMANISLWTMGNGVYPPPDSDVLKIPFTFTLPTQLYPSCEYGNYHAKFARIRYFVETVGKRPGIWRFNKRLVRAFPVLPPSDLGAELREAFQRGWQGPWCKTVKENDIRRGVWGEHSHVQMMLTLPEVETLPVFVPIPFTLTVITHSKSMKRDEKSSNEPIFPAPPLGPQEVDFFLESDVWIKAKSWDATRRGDFTAQLGGLGPQKLSPTDPVHIEAPEKVWIPADEKSEKGRWIQEVTFKSSIRLSCAPSFSSETMMLSVS
ncbi:hypothetical protein BDY19DRAFT_954117 [Irpex rosettiformis]|uniref:Uncharacterized protein n=1 Tax=Irpex rosettiformis TaxID=378272 RepID=A0ACB8TZK1_9APHY|nr:hypothetical protein BDY19DRAFT_954117 [Irpex rosettiformis]